jgi:methylenetetrahydrofolate--tRNA-(uracil-5-)-methyltransferase
VSSQRVTIIGGGLAGSEAAFQLAARGVDVTLMEMRPTVAGPAHHTSGLAELVCSNSFKADTGERPSATGMLKREMEALGSLVVRCARLTAVPAGGALAVDRARFSALVTRTLESMPGVDVVRAEANVLPDGHVIIATGPLTSPAFEPVLTHLVGDSRLAFFDAAAPIVEAASLDRSVCFPASRYDKGGGADYLNCPLDRDEYERFVEALLAAERVTRKEFEPDELFQACQPIEEVARSGRDAPRFGAMKPVGLIDPRTGHRPWAVVQLRPENRELTAYNLVGFQTNLTFSEQSRVFALIPGLGEAEFARFGVMHRNTFVDAPRLLTPDLALRTMPRVRLAGQLAGTEGYLEAAGAGLLAALATWCDLSGTPTPSFPRDTALGALVSYATDPATDPYQPMHVNFGIMPPLDPAVRNKAARHAAIVERGAAALHAFTQSGNHLAFARIGDVLEAVRP